MRHRAVWRCFGNHRVTTGHRSTHERACFGGRSRPREPEPQTRHLLRKGDAPDPTSPTASGDATSTGHRPPNVRGSTREPARRSQDSEGGFALSGVSIQIDGLDEHIREVVKEQVARLRVETEERWYTAAEAAEYLRVSRQRIHDLV